MNPVRVAVQADDAITSAGLTSVLEAQPGLCVVAKPARCDVIVFAADRVDAEVLDAMRRSAHEWSMPRVLVTNELNLDDVLGVIEARVVAVLPRAAATGTRLINSVIAAAEGGDMMAPDLLGELLKQVEDRGVLSSQGSTASGLTPREVDVLRLMAEGLDSAEIAEQLCYSVRTVKNVVYGVTRRLNLRNRQHAVAYAMRVGAI